MQNVENLCEGVELDEIMGFEFMDGNELFLGNPLFVKGNICNDFNFIIDKLMVKNTNALWVNILTAKYCRESGFWHCNLPRYASHVARGIWKTRQFINDNCLWLMGHDSKIQVWNNGWSCGDGVIIDASAINPHVVTDLPIHAFLTKNGVEWNTTEVKWVFRPSIAEVILNCRTEDFSEEDRLVWRNSPNGEFSIKAAYRCLHTATMFQDNTCTKIWKLGLQEHLKPILWKAYRDCIPFKSRYNRIFGWTVGDYSLCGEAYGDSEAHFFSTCPITCGLWRESKWGIRCEEPCLCSGNEVVKWIIDPSTIPGSIQVCDREEFSLFASVMYHPLWSIRNANYHNNTKWRFCDMKKNIWDEFHFQWKLVESERGDSFDGAPRPAVYWKQPRPGRIWVNVNFPTKDGVGAIGVVTWDEAIGKDAEVLRRLGIKEADILSDNQVVVQAHSALVTPFWNVFFLFSKALTMLSSKKIEVLWIPKTKNSSAHVLAKWGLFNNCKGFLNCWEVTPAHRDLKSL
ncbi:uncharacterized protein LOC115703919 [Cannabis sativa]|uniref:uncharacterized protein LOC115703919 n=1 Tax=Cannabis sativa TaxID=3483 RepID=UPI0029CA5611|nr:uncharacterized protein LOC115703919 [Cannabis sativa]